ncbi:hypothetical protein AB0M86_47380 [Streptomyces sp. NPDC051639]|uniref:hypothetical protein n=1 Tax=Streptomyces sp. NPDC051639 TaxID=3155671 RepID=UPI00341A7B90
MVDAIEHDHRRTLVPTLLDRGRRTVDMYASDPDSPARAAGLARRLAQVCCCWRFPTDDLAVDSLLSDHSQFLIGSRVVVGRRAANH